MLNLGKKANYNGNTVTEKLKHITPPQRKDRVRTDRWKWHAIRFQVNIQRNFLIRNLARTQKAPKLLLLWWWAPIEAPLGFCLFRQLPQYVSWTGQPRLPEMNRFWTEMIQPEPYWSAPVAMQRCCFGTIQNLPIVSESWALVYMLHLTMRSHFPIIGPAYNFIWLRRDFHATDYSNI